MDIIRNICVITLFSFAFLAVCPAGAVQVIDREGSWSYSLSANRDNGSGATEVFTVNVPDGYRANVTVAGRTFTANTTTSTADLWQGEAFVCSFSGRESTSPEMSFTGRGSFSLSVTATGYSSGVYYYCNLSYTVTVVFVPLRPDLRIVSLTASPDAAAAVGETVTLSFAVLNEGTAYAPATTVRLYDGSVLKKTVDVRSLSIGSRVELNAALADLSVGVRDFKAVVDEEGAITEISEGNNERTLRYRVYARTPYTVRFHANGGSGSMSAQSHVCGTPKALTANAFAGPKSRDGTVRRFLGWASATTGSVEYANGAMVTNLTFVNKGLVDLYAVWARRFILAYDGNGGYCDIAPVRLEEGGEIVVSSGVPVRDGYEFAGWSRSGGGSVKYSGGERATDIAGEDGSTVRLYAVWKPAKISVVYSRDAASDSYMSRRNDVSVREPMDWLGTTDLYYTDKTGGVRVTASTMMVAGLRIDCWFRTRPVEHTIRFDANGGTGTMPDLTVWSNSKFVLPKCRFVKPGYSFHCWSIKETVYNSLFAGDECDLNTEDITLYAIWMQDSVFVYKFEPNGGTGVMPDLVVTNKQLNLRELPPCKFSHPYLKFVDWDWRRYSTVTDGNVSTTTYYPIWGLELNPTDRYRGDVRFLTHAEKPLSYSAYAPEISTNNTWRMMDTTEGTVFVCSDIEQYTCGTLHIQSPASGMDKYWLKYRYRYQTLQQYSYLTSDYVSFPGFTQKNPECKRYWCEENRESGRDVEFKVSRHSWHTYGNSDWLTGVRGTFGIVDLVFFLRKSYEIGSCATNMTIDIASTEDWTTETTNDWVKISRDPANGYRAVVSVAANESIDSRTAEIKTSDDITLSITQAAGLKSVEITLYANGGTLSDPATLRVAAAFALGGSLPVPVRDGYAFTGWFTAATGGSEITSVSRLIADQMLFAHWEPAVYAVRFDAAGGTAAQSCRSVAAGTAIGALPVATRLGYAFLGWSYDDRVYVDETTEVSGDVTLRARWQALDSASAEIPDWTYRIAFVPNGGVGDGISPVYVMRGTVAILPPCSWRNPGCRFAGWACSNGKRYDDGVLVFNLAEPGETVTMTAIWE